MKSFYSLTYFYHLLVRIWNILLRQPFDVRDRTAFIAETNLPTNKGVYRVRAYRSNKNPGYEPQAIIFGKVEGLEEVPIRVHDACFTSEVIGSQKCDCKDQLDYSLHYIKNNGPGIVIYLQQEGRGIGLSNKIAAYSLQEKGFDTVEANRKLGLPDDCRSYDAVVDILKDLDVRSVRLLTNNPRKIDVLRTLGVKINSRIPIQMEANHTNLNYLKTKASRMQHFLDYDAQGKSTLSCEHASTRNVVLLPDDLSN
eukprot:TRINITY_DN977_c0_g1_i1.p1 TRINITY_DN977_c0_g1~~TRINITY_DN977_c0_g1_i1.p1  ORF type:complete len:254 (-),score=35.66 TRINITY_DN977_c0_g1_i1:15-776(-)